MTVWYYIPTIFNRQYGLRLVALLALCIALITTLFLPSLSQAAPGVNQVIGFQGRLLRANGSVVPDGYYNIEFKIYQDGSGTAAGNPDGTLEWTETRINDGGTDGVRVKNGYFSADLGSVNPFGTSVDWNQDTLWLSMNIAGSATDCTTFGSGTCLADGEMLPMKRLTSTPYALNAGKVGGKSVDELIQNNDTATAQTADFNISGIGKASSLQGNTSVIAPLFDRDSTGTLSIGTTNASTIDIATNNADHTINVGSGTGNQTITVGSTSGTSSLNLQAGSGDVGVYTQGSFTVNSGGVDVLTAQNDGGAARVGIGTDSPTTALHVSINDAVVNRPAFLLQQQGSGDASLELKDSSGKSFYVGMDSSNGSSFKIASSTSLQSSINIGTTVIGGSSTSGLDNTIMTKKVTTGSEGGTVSSISVYVSAVDSGAPGVKVGLYSHDAANSRPGNLLASTTTSQTLVTGWNTIPLGTAVSASTPYWIAMKSEGTSTFRYDYCGGCAGDSAYYGSRPFGDDWPSTIGAPSSSSTNENYSWYMTVTYGAISDTFSGANLFNLTDTGALTLQNSTNSTSAFNIQNAAGSSILNVDTSNSLVGISAGVGIGNSGSSSYALDVTGDINTSSQYNIDGETALTASALAFSGASESTITAATGQELSINSDSGVTISIDGAASASFNDTNVQIGDGATTGAPTLLTLDGATTAPTGILGSMYYDDTLGKVQCYEADGWGACSAAPDTFISLSPEYTNAVMNGTDIGTITSDICSDTLNINDGSSSQPTICGTNETQNFYNWTSSESTAQTRSIYLTYQLPANFKEFVAGSTSVLGRTDSGDATVTYQVYRDTAASGLISCGSAVSVSTGAQTSWQQGTASGGADPSTCGFVTGDSLLIRVNLSASNDANAYVSDVDFTFSNN